MFQRYAQIHLPGIIAAVLAAGPGPEKPTVFVDATILTATDRDFSPGTLVVKKGKFIAVRPKYGTAIPADAPVVSLARKTVIPGLVDTRSHLGLFGFGGGASHGW